MTGMDFRFASLWIRAVSSMPSIRGISMSVTTRSNCPVLTAFQPSIPSTATSTS